MSLRGAGSGMETRRTEAHVEGVDNMRRAGAGSSLRSRLLR